MSSNGPRRPVYSYWPTAAGHSNVTNCLMLSITLNQGRTCSVQANDFNLMPATARFQYDAVKGTYRRDIPEMGGTDIDHDLSNGFQN